MSWFSEVDMSNNNGVSACVKIGDWIKLMCLSLLNLIPFVGWIVYIVLYLYLAFSSNTAESVKNYLKASLILSAVCIALSIVLVVVFASFLASAFAGLPGSSTF